MPIRPTSPSSLQELLAESDSRLQMSGLFSARGVGLKRFLGSVEMEAIVQAPSSLYLSVRSFFSQPARVLKTSGEVLDIQEMLPIQILPYELVDVILGRVSIGEGRVLELSDTCLRVGRPSGDTEQITFRMPHYVVIERSLSDANGRLVYSVKYEDFQQRAGMDVAARWKFEARVDDDTHRFTLTGDDVTFNGKPFGPETFSHD